VPYPASSYFGQEVKYLVIELHTTSQRCGDGPRFWAKAEVRSLTDLLICRVGHGTLFNLGVDYAIGEMLFFMDGGGESHQDC
jgi:hypothetical protein